MRAVALNWCTTVRPQVRAAVMAPNSVPQVTFHIRVRNEALGGPNPFEWKDLSSDEVFRGKRIVLFAVPGAFTPACSDSHLPGYERRYDEFLALGIDQVVCLAVNDAFVMFQWAQSREIEKVFMLPDGNGDFTRRMGMLVERTKQGMGLRSWRYSMLIEDGEIKKMFVEPDVRDNPAGVGLSVSDAGTMLGYLRQLGPERGLGPNSEAEVK
jgi:peroxiredoxin